MSKNAVQVNKIYVESNYIVFESTLSKPGSRTSRGFKYFYPKGATSFYIQQDEVSGEYSNNFMILNNWNRETTQIKEADLVASRITDSGRTAYTVETFTSFLLANTGA